MIEYYVTIKIEGKLSQCFTLTKEELEDDFDKYLAIADSIHITIDKVDRVHECYDQQAVS